MEPTLPAPNGSPEMRPQASTPEHAPVPQNVEVQTGYESQETRERKVSGGGSNHQVVKADDTTAVAAPVQAVAQNPLPVQVPVDDSPATAGDEDLIEKEWVDKAKRVIAETKHDPYMQERAVSRLQANYIQKRYGKTVKLPEEN